MLFQQQHSSKLQFGQSLADTLMLDSFGVKLMQPGFFITFAMKFVAISAHLMIALLTSADAIRKIYTLMLIIDSHLGLLITGLQYITSFQYIVKDFFKLFKTT